MISNSARQIPDRNPGSGYLILLFILFFYFSTRFFGC